MYTISREEFKNQNFTLSTLRETAQFLWECGNQLYDYEVKKNGKQLSGSLIEEFRKL